MEPLTSRDEETPRFASRWVGGGHEDPGVVVIICCADGGMFSDFHRRNAVAPLSHVRCSIRGTTIEPPTQKFVIQYRSTYYEIEYSDAGSTWMPLAVGVTETAYADTSLEAGSTATTRYMPTMRKVRAWRRRLPERRPWTCWAAPVT